MALSRELALDDAQIDDMLTNDWNVRIASVDANGNINLTPMWFSWAGGRMYIMGRGQKVVNLRRNEKCTVLVDRNERFPELQAIMMRGTAKILETAEEEAADPHLAEAQAQMGVKYNGGHGTPAQENPGPTKSTATGRNRRWIVFTPERTVTWDNFKLKRLA
jgi:nitroimidazol reductase NimA-like FMN-containing flavoprotein (pyridoxamine 5'-phosphate oxidase superfamily)